jgi:hypothetical protein
VACSWTRKGVFPVTLVELLIVAVVLLAVLRPVK